MRLTQPAARPSRWRYLLFRRLTKAAYPVAGWLYRQQVKHTPPVTPGRPRVNLSPGLFDATGIRWKPQPTWMGHATPTERTKP